jgi:hypothetical protein
MQNVKPREKIQTRACNQIILIDDYFTCMRLQNKNGDAKAAGNHHRRCQASKSSKQGKQIETVEV